MRKLRAFVASLGKVLGGWSAARGDCVIRRGIWYQASRPTLRRSGWCRVSLSCAASKALRAQHAAAAGGGRATWGGEDRLIPRDVSTPSTLWQCHTAHATHLRRPGSAGEHKLGRSNYNQSSTRKLGTCWKSRRFRDRSVASWAKTILAIFRSIVPIRTRCLRSPCKMSAASVSHGSTCHAAKNAIRRWRR